MPEVEGNFGAVETLDLIGSIVAGKGHHNAPSLREDSAGRKRFTVSLLRSIALIFSFGVCQMRRTSKRSHQAIVLPRGSMRSGLSRERPRFTSAGDSIASSGSM